jgi:myosin heavy subunit
MMMFSSSTTSSSINNNKLSTMLPTPTTTTAENTNTINNTSTKSTSSTNNKTSHPTTTTNHDNDFFPSSSSIYVPHPEHGYIHGIVSPDCEEGGFFRSKLGKVIVNENELLLTAQQTNKIERRYELETNINDLAKLQDMSRASILAHVNDRYCRDEIYTNVGPILLSVNPYRSLPNLYSLQTRSKYLKATIQQQQQQTTTTTTKTTTSSYDLLSETTPPHIYQVAERTFRGVKSGIDQSVIFSGESGAGKTEATKIFLGYIAHASEYGTAAHVRQRLLEANPLIEAFGNAKTARNDNSSRFGAWLEIRVTPQGAISGATLTNYLLEKTRVVKHAVKERNFHIFYQLPYAATSSLLKTNFNINSYRVLMPTIPTAAGQQFDEATIAANNITTNKDASQWEVTNKALQAFNLDPVKICRIVTGVLELTQVMFTSQLHPVTGDECCTIKDVNQLQKACSLLGIKYEQCEKALLERDMSNIKEEIFKPHSHAQAEEARDSLAKHIYGRLFDFLVRSVNEGIKPASTNNTAITSADTTNHNFIGLLDTFGFESFTKNSFEQLLINYCNERIMAHFNSACIAIEERLYLEEGLTNVNIEYESNAKVLDFFEQSPRGLFSMLDDEIRLPKGTDTTFLGKMRDIQRATPSQVFIPHLAESKSGSKLTFGIRHFAGEVYYEASEFLDKNRDSLPPQLENLCIESMDDFIKTELFAPEIKSMSSTSPKKASPTKRIITKSSTNGVEASPAVITSMLEKIGSARAHQKVSLATRFQAQLNDLTHKISKTNTHFVRCLKPNDVEAANNFHGQIVLDQLRYGGVLEACRLRRNGYSVRRDFDTFLQDFKRLHPSSAKTVQDLVSFLIRTKFNGDSNRIRVGKTLVFLRAGELAELEHALHDLETRAAIQIQKMFRRRAEHERHQERMVFLKKLDDAVAQLNDQRIDSLLSGPENCLPFKGKKFPRVRKAMQISRELKAEAMVVAQLTFAIQKREKQLLQTALVEADALKHDLKGQVHRMKQLAREELLALEKEEADGIERARIQEQFKQQKLEEELKEKQYQAWLLSSHLNKALEDRNLKVLETILKNCPTEYQQRDEILRAREFLQRELKRIADRIQDAELKLTDVVKKSEIKLESAKTMGSPTLIYFDDVLYLNRAIDEGEKAGVGKELLRRAMAVQAELKNVLAQQEMIQQMKKKNSWWASCTSCCTVTTTATTTNGVKTTREMDG